TDSRTMPAGFAAKRVVDAAHSARGARIVYKKLDSTLRGNVAAELAAALNAARRDLAIVAPAFPAAGRTTVGGNQLVNGVPVHETEMGNDPSTPVRESHVPTMLADTFSSVGTLRAEDLRDPVRVRQTLRDYECVVADAERDGDLEALVRAVPDPARVLWSGSAGLAHALGSVHPGPYAGEAGMLRTPACPVLVVIGSLSGVAREQLRRLVEEYGDVAVPVRGGESGALERAVDAVREALTTGACAVVHSPEQRSASGGPVLKPLAEVAACLSEEGLLNGLVLTGGSTAVKVSRRLGASGIRLEGEVETGIPLGTLIGPRPYPVVTKAGGFGGPDTLVRAVEALAQCGEEKNT
ncbi:MAG TPA: four-carbon acid sugar kinase family protein, partial [Rubrobacter sp.]|nr:four-carbon acid sugar kinase family protein [Rubrobacter sp.]